MQSTSQLICQLLSDHLFLVISCWSQSPYASPSSPSPSTGRIVNHLLGPSFMHNTFIHYLNQVPYDGSLSKGARSSLLIRSLRYNCLPDGLISRNKYNFIVKLIFPKDTNLRVSNGYCPTSSIPRIEFYSLFRGFICLQLVKDMGAFFPVSI